MIRGDDAGIWVIECYHELEELLKGGFSSKAFSDLHMEYVNAGIKPPSPEVIMERRIKNLNMQIPLFTNRIVCHLKND